MSNLLTHSTARNLLENLEFPEGRPGMETVLAEDGVQIKRVTLKAGTELKCHKTTDHVLVVWLRGNATFFTDTEDHPMQPGMSVEMPPGTPHGANAETDCVFLVTKIRPAG